MHPKISRFKLNISGRRWLRFLTVGCVAVLAPFLMVPRLTQANFLDWRAKEVTVTFTEGTNLAAAPSPDGETIILAIQGSLWRVGSGGGEAKRLTGWQVEATWPVWAPDGSRIAFQNYSDNTYHIWTIRPDGSDLRQVTSGLFDHREPAWSPDGRKIAFSSDRSGNGSYDIWTIDLATKAYEQRTSMTTEKHSPAWSPDGTRIAYADGRFVFAVDPAGQREMLASVPTGTVQAPAWFPNGQGVAYQHLQLQSNRAADGIKMIGICFLELGANTSSVTAPMSSATVVLIILRGPIMFPLYAAISVARQKPADADELRDPAKGSCLAA